MSTLENHGLIIREIRLIQDLSVRTAAQRINRGVGWLSEIENGTGTAKISSNEFDRIIKALGAEKFRPMFKTWVANAKNAVRIDKTYDGAILKHIRIKVNLRLKDAARCAGVSPGYLSALENGLRPMTLKMRFRLMKAYGYSPKSFKNLHSDPKKSKAVSPHFKLQILLKQMTNEQIRALFKAALEQFR